MKRIIILIFLIIECTTLFAQFRAGAARKSITPEIPIWLSGYASRKAPSTEVLQDLWTKALVIEENPKSRMIIVTADIIGFSHEVSEDVAKRVIEKYGIERSQLLLSSSHTHSGPVIWPSLNNMFDLDTSDIQALVTYSHRLSDAIIGVIDSAMNNLSPCQLLIGHGSAGFAANRRKSTEKGVVIGVNPDGPVDHDVPVLKVVASGDKLKAILFGYACHNTTLSINQVNGDYAGFAQVEIEKTNPGAVAMFIAGCGSDQNPQPRGTVELAMQHGRTLAEGVQKALSGDLIPVRPPIRTSFTVTDLEFQPFDFEKYQKELLSNDQYRQRRARFLLDAHDKGWDVERLKYPVQAIRFNKYFTIVALSGEVVVDYSLIVKRDYPKENIFVAGYCTEVQCYIPTRRILKEGGYEPETSMVYYGLPGPFTYDVEEKVLKAVSFVMRDTRARR